MKLVNDTESEQEFEIEWECPTCDHVHFNFYVLEPGEVRVIDSNTLLIRYHGTSRRVVS